MKLVIIVIAMVFLCFMSCEKDINIDENQNVIHIPKGFPQVVFPEDNQYSYDRWELGKKLFFDPILSADNSISCATCHLPEKAFTDGLEKAVGVDNRIGSRNAPSLSNIAYHPYFTREGGIPSLEMQVLVPIQEHDEFDFNIVLIAERLNENQEFVNMSLQAFNRLPDPYVITRAIASFERSFISGDSKYDQFQNNETNFSDSEFRGMELFFSEKLACSNCHGGFDFTNYSIENNGLYTDYPDTGRFRLTGDSIDLAKFKIPSLRNVALTAPYMHDGSMNSLEKIIIHYSNGGKSHQNKSSLIRGFEISTQETNDLISFLHTLSDYSFIENPLFKN